ncbi:MAG TPA: hypothetical protein VMZ53_15375 [Kofleriaceae bacterium]|nr:hypothetical protein [Kofleriaceae bacterium]
MRCSVVVLALVLASSVASAQPGWNQFSPPGLTPPTVQLSPTPGGPRKDPSTAVLLSLGITTASYITLFAAEDHEGLQLLAFAGTYFGPSTGQWYAGQVGGLGLGLRAAGFVLALYGISQLLSEDDCEYDYDCSDSSADTGALAFWGGAGLWVGSTVYDIVLARRAAESWNARHSVAIAPMVTADAGGNRTPGLVLTGRF